MCGDQYNMLHEIGNHENCIQKSIQTRSSYHKSIEKKTQATHPMEKDNQKHELPRSHLNMETKHDPKLVSVIPLRTKKQHRWHMNKRQ